MKIALLTPGAGGMYCGNCLRDFALAKALRALGHDAIIVPLYLPLTLEDPGAKADTPLFFGGVNVYLQHKTSFFRKNRTGLGVFEKLMNSPTLLGFAASFAGKTDPKELGDLTLSMLRGEEGNQIKELDKLAGFLKNELKPDIVCFSNGMLFGMARRIRELSGAKVWGTLQGEDFFLDHLPAPYNVDCWKVMSERGAELDRVIGISKYYSNLMAERMQWKSDKIQVIYNGIALDEYKVNEPLPALPSVPTLGYFARYAPEKGLPTLINAFGYLKSKNTPENLILRTAGSLTPGDQKFFDGVKADIAKRGLTQSIFLEPNVSKARKIEFMRALSVFSVPATLGEGFGLYLLEAWASGVPVVQPRTAAFVELLEATNGGVLYEPGDAFALAAQAEPLLSNPAKAREIGEHARNVVKERFSAQRMAQDFLALA